jgi:hypothetical protein
MAERFTDIRRNARNAEEIRTVVERAETSETGDFAKGVAAGIRWALGTGAPPFPTATAKERSAPEAIARRASDVARRQANPDGVGAGAGGATPATTTPATPA